MPTTTAISQGLVLEPPSPFLLYINGIPMPCIILKYLFMHLHYTVLQHQW